MQPSTPSLGTLMGPRDSIPRDFLKALTLSEKKLNQGGFPGSHCLPRDLTFTFNLYFTKMKSIELWDTPTILDSSVSPTKVSLPPGWSLWL